MSTLVRSLALVGVAAPLAFTCTTPGASQGERDVRTLEFAPPPADNPLRGLTPYVTADASGPKHLTQKLTRSKLEQLVRPIIDRCKHPVENALRDKNLSANDITKIILVGGPTRMPIVQQFVENTIFAMKHHRHKPQWNIWINFRFAHRMIP